MTIDELKVEMDGRFEQVDRRFEQVDGRFDELKAEMDRRFEGVDRRFDELSAQGRLLHEDVRGDIRKLAEALGAVIVRLDEVAGRVTGHNGRLGNHELRLKRLEGGKPGRR